MAEHALIACRVTSETKARVRNLAERDGITESTLVRQLLDVVLRTSGLDESPTMAPPDKVNRDARLNVRLEPEDWRLLRERARARGMASATYLSYLARSHLRGAAPLPKIEYTLLKQSVEHLGAVGRDLNQIARALNQGGRSAVPGRADVATMLKMSQGLRDHFRALLEANEASMEDGSCHEFTLTLAVEPGGSIWGATPGGDPDAAIVSRRGRSQPSIAPCVVHPKS